MYTKKGMIVKMEDQQTYIVDDVKVVDNKEYVILYSTEKIAFYLATESIVDGQVQYNFLEQEEAVKIAEQIDKMDHLDD